MPTFKKQRMITGKAIRAQSADFVKSGESLKRMPHVQAMKLGRMYVNGTLDTPMCIDRANVKGDEKNFFTAQYSPFHCACCGPNVIDFVWHEDCKPVARWSLDTHKGILPQTK